MNWKWIKNENRHITNHSRAKSKISPTSLESTKLVQRVLFIQAENN